MMLVWQSILLSCLLCCLWYEEEVCGQDFNPLPRNRRPRPTTSAVLPRSFSSNAIADAFQTADDNLATERRSTTSIRSRGRPMDQRTDAPTFRHRFFQRSTPRSRQLERVQERFEEASRVLQEQYNLTPRQVVEGLAQADVQNALPDNTVAECRALFNVSNCNANDRYRSFDGTCNNLEHSSWGMAASCFERLMDPVYADGISELRLSVTGRELPTPRTISLQIHAHMDNPTDYVTHIFMQWGQFLDHDISLSPLDNIVDNTELSCCPLEDNQPRQCAPIILDRDDEFFSQFGIDCLDNFRTVICSTCEMGARQQTNQLTAYIDGSMIYGINTDAANSLRDRNGNGTLISINRNNLELLPPSTNPADGCSFQAQNAEEVCFRGGDPRINQHTALTSLHIIFLREHNRLARRLRAINPRWNEERLFQETRRIIGAQLQMITYKEFLPLVIGPERMQWFDLNVQQRQYTQYDPTVDATLVNEFSTAAFRFGHSMVNSMFPEISRQSSSGNRLRDLFLWPFDHYRRGHLEGIVRGMYQSPAQKFDRHMVRDLTNHLYQNRGNSTGLDLASFNVLRGRDHGIPPYVDVVNFCGGPNITSFRQLDRLFQRGYRQLFQRVYESVEDIDLFSGGLAERPNQGAVVGPTFTCIIGIQFYHLRYGDRFYFEHGRQAGSFSPGQLRELRKTTFAKIICTNSDISVIQRLVMINPTRRNPEVSCEELPDLDLRHWRA